MEKNKIIAIICFVLIISLFLIKVPMYSQLSHIVGENYKLQMLSMLQEENLLSVDSKVADKLVNSDKLLNVGARGIADYLIESKIVDQKDLEYTTEYLYELRNSQCYSTRPFIHKDHGVIQKCIQISQPGMDFREAIAIQVVDNLKDEGLLSVSYEVAKQSITTDGLFNGVAKEINNYLKELEIIDENDDDERSISMLKKYIENTLFHRIPKIHIHCPGAVR